MSDLNNIFQRIGKKRIILIVIALVFSFGCSFFRAVFARDEYTAFFSCICLLFVYICNFIPEYIIIKTFCKSKKLKILLFMMIMFLDMFFLIDYTYRLLSQYSIV